MKRWGYPLIVITFLLLAGAVVNVAVAWGIAGFASQRRYPLGVLMILARSYEIKRDFQLGTERLYDDHGRHDLIPAADRFAEGEAVVPMERSPGLQFSATGRRSDYVVRVEVGWPRRSLCYTALYSNGVCLRSGPRAPDVKPALFRATYGGVPAALVPAGFAINTLFYTAILALPLSFFPIRRRLRAGRGRCPKCGYDLAGLADPAAPCPECGAAP